MKDAQKPDHVSLATLVGRLREGRFVIPDFQREFEWQPWDISLLMRSIFLDYFIGSLLLWKGKEENFTALACEPIYAFEGSTNDEYIVLDGQQRLTAMYYAFMAPDAPAPRRTNRFFYFINVEKFMQEAYDDAFLYDWTKQGQKLAEDAETQFEKHMFPLCVVGQTGWALPNWVQGYEKYWEDKVAGFEDIGELNKEVVARQNADNAHAFGEHLRGITEQYQIAFVELDQHLELGKVCDIFTQINSRGIRLDVFDLFNALLRPRGLQLRHMWRQAETKLDFVDTDRMNVYVLQVMSILRQAYCSPKYLYYLLPGQERQFRETDGSFRKEILVPDAGDFEDRWNQAVDSLAQAINLLRHPQEFGAILSRYLPYVSILPVFAALQTVVGQLPAQNRLVSQRKIRHWYWASVFLNRYSGSVESTAARDYLDLNAWFDDDKLVPAMISDFKERFRSIAIRRETRRGTSIYNGIFNLLVLAGARDWMTANVPQHDDLDDHHIVPRAWGKKNAVEGSVDSILNRTPLTGDTNRKVIRDRLPNEYLPELIIASDEESVRKILESHFISPAAFDILLRDPFTAEDFEAFLTERQRSIQDGIEDLLVKSRLDLPPRLRELDAQIETLELRLRQVIADTLNDDPAALPSHIQKTLGDRLQRAAKQNPALDVGDYETIKGQFEFADMRELEDTIVTKTLWPRFEARFISKEQLASRFRQLSELRNSIRHSRQVTDITLKDGEAAILWFATVIEK